MRWALGVEYDGSSFHGWQVQEDLDDPLEAVVRGAAQTRPVGHRDLGHPGPPPARVDRDETVHLPVEPHRLDHVAPVGLQRTAVVVQVYALGPGE